MANLVRLSETLPRVRRGAGPNGETLLTFAGSQVGDHVLVLRPTRSDYRGRGAQFRALGELDHGLIPDAAAVE
jgi:hypothetical protein